MLVTKINLLIAAIVAGFTVMVPGTAFFVTYQALTQEIIATTELAEKIEKVAAEIEEGRISPTQERFALAVRTQAVAERDRVKTLTHFQAAGKNFLIAVLATAALQLTLVLLVLGRRASASAA